MPSPRHQIQLVMRLSDCRPGNIGRNHTSDGRIEADGRTEDRSPLGRRRAELMDEIVDRVPGPMFDISMIRNDEATAVVDALSILSPSARRDFADQGKGHSRRAMSRVTTPSSLSIIVNSVPLSLRMSRRQTRLSMMQPSLRSTLLARCRRAARRPGSQKPQ